MESNLSGGWSALVRVSAQIGRGCHPGHHSLEPPITADHLRCHFSPIYASLALSPIFRHCWKLFLIHRLPESHSKHLGQGNLMCSTPLIQEWYAYEPLRGMKTKKVEASNAYLLKTRWKTAKENCLFWKCPCHPAKSSDELRLSMQRASTLWATAFICITLSQSMETKLLPSSSSSSLNSLGIYLA